MSGKMLYKYVLSVFITAVLLNFAWEMIQMPFFEGMTYDSPGNWLLCFRASITDALLILLIFGAGKLLFKKWDWPLKLNVRKVSFLLVAGFIIAVYFEIDALQTGRWAYSIHMTILPPWGVGLVPLLQMLLLPYVSFKVGARFLPC